MNFEKVLCLFGKKYAPHILILVAAFVVFLNAVNGPFLLDDFSLIVNNPSIQSLSNAPDWFISDRLSGTNFSSGFYRPLAAATHAFMYAIFQLDHIPYHLLNILLHACSGIVVFMFLMRLSFSRLTATLAALAYTIHPIHSESVAYVAGLADVQSGLLIILALTLFLSPQPNQKATNSRVIKGIIFTSLATLGALLTKESAVVILPICITLYIFDSAIGKKRSYQKKLLLIIGIITAIYLGLRMSILDFSTGIVEESTVMTGGTYADNLLLRLSLFPAIVYEYMRLIFLPIELHTIREFESLKPILSLQGLLGSLVIFGGGAVAVRDAGRRRAQEKPYIFIAYSIFFLALLPVIGFFVLNTPYSERFLYVPLLGIIVLISHFFSRKLNNETIFKFVSLAFFVILLLGYRTMDRNRDFVSSINFYENEFVYLPESPRVLHELGVSYYIDGDIERAIPLYLKAIENKSDFDYAYFNLANAYMNTYQAKPERLSLGLDAYFNSIKHNPNLHESYAAIYQIYFHLLDEKEKAGIVRKMIDRIDAGEEIAFEELEMLRSNKPL